MSQSYSEFMSQQPIARFPSGKHGGKILNWLFHRPKVDKSPERMEHLKEMLAESKIGQQTLDFLQSNETSLDFEKAECYGYYNPDYNKIALNPYMSDEDLLTTLVHETRHAWQSTKMDTNTPKMTPKAFLMTGFAAEADACAAEVSFAYEMKEKNPKIWEAHQKSPYGEMGNVYEKAMNETGDAGKARAEAMMAWYNLPVKQKYTGQYTEFLSLVANGWLMNPANFTEDRDGQMLADAFGTDYEGKRFFSDGKALESEKRIYVDETQADDLCSSMFRYMTGCERSAEDFGLDKIAVHCQDGKKTTCADIVRQYQEATEKPKSKTKKINTVLKAVLRNRQR